MSQELRNMRIRQVSLVDKGATGRTFALLKRDAGAVRKDVPTFGMLQGAREIATWLPEALYSLGQVVDAAVAGDPNDPAVTPELRLDRRPWIRRRVQRAAARARRRGDRRPGAGGRRCEAASPGSWRGLM